MTCRWCFVKLADSYSYEQHAEWHRKNDLHGGSCAAQDREGTFYRCNCGLR